MLFADHNIRSFSHTNKAELNRIELIERDEGRYEEKREQKVWCVSAEQIKLKSMLKELMTACHLTSSAFIVNDTLSFNCTSILHFCPLSTLFWEKDLRVSEEISKSVLRFTKIPNIFIPLSVNSAFHIDFTALYACFIDSSLCFYLRGNISDKTNSLEL